MDPLTIGLLFLSGFSTLGGLVQSSVNSGKVDKQSKELMQDQFNYQQLLNEQMQNYARENATTAYNRQRELLGDMASIQRQGLSKAGYSTMSGTLGASAPNVAIAPSSSGGSAPSASGAISAKSNALSQLAKSFSSISDFGLDTVLKKDQSKLLSSQEEYQSIINAGARAEQLARIEGLKKDNLIKDADYQRLKNDLEIQEKTMDAQISLKINEAIDKQLSNELKQNEVDMLEYTNKLKKLSVDIKEGEYQMLQKDLDTYDERFAASLKEIYSNINLKDNQSLESAAERGLILSKTYGQDLANLFAKVTRGVDIATKELVMHNIAATYDLIKKKIQLAASQIDWTDAKAVREWTGVVGDIVDTSLDVFMKSTKKGLIPDTNKNTDSESVSNPENSGTGSIFDLDTFGDDWDNIPFGERRKLYGKGSLLE